MRSPRARFALVFVLAFVIYNANGRLISTGDAYAARAIPFAIWLHGTLALDPLDELVTQAHPTPYWKFPALDGSTASLFPIVTPVAVTPLYAPVIVAGHRLGWNQPRLEAAARVMEKLSASLIASLAVALFWLVARRVAPEPTAWTVTMALAFATSTWTISSQGLWTHGLGEVLVAASLLMVLSGCTSRRAIIVGFALGLMVVNRPQDVFLAAGLGLFAWVWAGRGAARAELVIGGLVAAVPFVAYNIDNFAHPVGAYAVAIPDPFILAPGFWTGLAGLLISPARGLFVFSPWLIAVPVGVWLWWRRAEYRLLVACLLGAVVSQVLFYSMVDWKAGYSYGPRFLTDMAPMLAFLAIPAVQGASDAGRLLLAAALVVSVSVQVIGAWRYTGTSNVFYDAEPTWSQAWVVGNTQWVLEARNPRQPADLIHQVRRFVRGE